MTETAFVSPPAATPPRSSAGFRVVDAGALVTLERLQASNALVNGHVNLIAFDALAEGLGRRWRHEQDRVHAHAEQALHLRLGNDGFCQRISQTDYVVVQPGAGRLAAQVLCLGAMRETLLHFLGAAPPAALVVHEVTRITADGVFGERIDAEAALAADRRIRREAEAGGPGSLDPWAPFVTSDGRAVRVSCQLEPVFQLKSSQRIGYRVARRVLHMPHETPLSAAERRNLARADIERVDFATLSRGLDRLRSDGDPDRQPTLILPVSFTTLSSPRAAGTIVDYFKEAQRTVRHGVIGEICDIDGAPPGALLAAVHLIRPYCLFAVAQLAEAPTSKLGALRESGLQGVSIELPQVEAGEAAFIGWTSALVSAARPAIKSVIVYQLASPRQAAIAGAFGVTHASIKPTT
jgi:hypothetical protein